MSTNAPSAATATGSNQGATTMRPAPKQLDGPSHDPLALKPIEQATQRTQSNRSNVLALAKGRSTALAVGPRVHVGSATGSFIQALATGRQYADLTVGEKRQVVVVCYDKPTARHLSDHLKQHVADQQVRVVGPKTDSPPNYYQPDGRAIAKAALPKDCDVAILSLPPGRGKTSVPLAGLGELLRTMQASCEHPVFVFQNLSDDDKLALPAFFDVVFDVEDCDPDCGYAFATMISHGAGSLLAALRRTPVIDNVRVGDDGTLEHNISDCVSPDPMSREISKLLDQGMTLEQIGAQLGRDKSTISRRIAALPFKPQRRNGSPQ